MGLGADGVLRRKSAPVGTDGTVVSLRGIEFLPVAMQLGQAWRCAIGGVSA